MPRISRQRFALALTLGAVLLSACAPAPDDPAAGQQGAPPPSADEQLASNLTEGCAQAGSQDVDYFPDKVEFVDAVGATVTYHDTYKVVEVIPPDLPDAQPVRLVLQQCGTPEPELTGALADAQVIEVPVESVVTLTTTNLPHFAELDAVDRLAGVGAGAYVATPAVRERIDAGDLDDYADGEGNADLERLLAAGPDLLVVDGFGETVLDDVSRYVDAGVPTAVNADFNERTLLGRAEWLKFTALFWNAEAAATAAYDEIAASYREIVDRAAAIEQRPAVLVNTPFEGTWFTPGGDSFLANAIADAGGDYVFADDDSPGSLQLDIETVLDAARDADVWLQAGSMHGSLADLEAQDARFAKFRAFTDGQVWAYDRQTTEGGGNAVFETAYTRADLFLADLAKILHPEEFADHELEFFGQVPSPEG